MYVCMYVCMFFVTRKKIKAMKTQGDNKYCHSSTHVGYKKLKKQ